MESLEDRVLILAEELFDGIQEIFHEDDNTSIQSLTEHGWYRTHVTYFGEPKIPLTKSTPEERLEQARKDLTRKCHDKITSLKSAITRANVVECESAD